MARVSLLRNKDFILLFIGQTVSRMGSILYEFAIGWYILELTGEAKYMGLYLSLSMIVRTVVKLIGGIIADKFNKKKIIYMTDALNGVLMLLIGFILYIANEANIILLSLYVVAVIKGVIDALFSPATMALIPNIVDEDELQQAGALNQSSYHVSGIVGAVFGAVLYDKYGIVSIVVINGISYLLSAISETFIKYEFENKYDKTIMQLLLSFKEIFRSLGHSVKYLFGEKGILALIKYAVLINFFGAPLFQIIVPYILKEELNADISYLAYINISLTVGMLLSSIVLVFLKQRDKISSIFKFSMIPEVVMISLFTFVTYLVLNGNIEIYMFLISSVVIFLFIGIISSIINIPIGVALQKYIDKDMLGRVGSMLDFSFSLVIPFSIMISSLAIDYLSVLNLMYIQLIGIFVTVIFIFMSKNLNKI